MSAEQMQEAVVKPLRFCGYCAAWQSKPCGDGCVWQPSMPTELPEAAASSQERIAQLEAEQDGLREALRQIAEAGTAHGMPSPDMVEAMRDIAKEALK